MNLRIRHKQNFLAVVAISISLNFATGSAMADSVSTATSATNPGTESIPAIPPLSASPVVPGVVAVPVTSGSSTTTITTTTSSATSTELLLRSQPIEQTVQRSIELKDADLQPQKIRTDKKLANRLAKSHWLEKAAAEDPEIIAAITQYSGSAKILAKHPRLGHIAEYDHYLCRQLTKWKGASRVLAKNPQAQAVVYYDPEGIYRAIKVDRATARRLSKNTEFAQMVIDNPDLAKVLASYM